MCVGEMTRSVDLRLAVNYLPACACLGKMFVLMLVVAAMVPPGEEVDWYVPMAALLYLDRMVVRNMIFDANAILLAVFFSDVVAQLRAVSTRRAYPGLLDGMFLFWALGSVMLLAEPQAVRLALERRPRANKLVPVLLMLVIVPAIARFHDGLETGVSRSCRAFAFTFLAFAWIYIVGIHTTRGIEHLKENSCQFVARLSPVLYASQWIAIVFTLAAAGALGMQFVRLTGCPSAPLTPQAVNDGNDERRTHAEEGVTHPTSTIIPTGTPAAPPPSQQTSKEDNDCEEGPSSIEELFRLARNQQQQQQMRMGGRAGMAAFSPLEPILELV